MTSGICAECHCTNGDSTDYLCEGCRAKICGCKATPTFGVVPADDPRCFGGHVSSSVESVEGEEVIIYIRHDPMRHAKDCPYAK